MEAWEDPSQMGAGGASSPTAIHPEGTYHGEFVTFESGCTPSGTDYIRLYFNVAELGQVEVSIWLTEKTAEFATRDLLRAGWNGNPQNPAFAPDGLVPLKCKHETYKGKIQARFQIWSSPKPMNANALQRMAALAKQMATPPPPPGQPKNPIAAVVPKPPTAAAPAKSAQASAPPARPTPAKQPDRAMPTTQEECWAYWVGGMTTGDAEGLAEPFWQAIDTVRGDIPVDAMTAEHWAKVAGYKPPF